LFSLSKSANTGLGDTTMMLERKFDSSEVSCTLKDMPTNVTED